MSGVYRHSGLTAQRLRERLSYDAESGLFRPRGKTPGGGREDGVAGSATSHGYWRIGIDCVVYPAHRLAWLYVYGELPAGEIDHINGDGCDNRIANLRLATRQQNAANRAGSGSRKIGRLKGASFCTRTGRWRAAIKVNGRTIHLGRHETEAEAHQAYLRAAKMHFGEFARGL